MASFKYNYLCVEVFTVRSSSCGKVMFSQACITHSVNRGEACVAKGTMHGGGMHGRRVGMAGGVHGRGACMCHGCRLRAGISDRPVYMSGHYGDSVWDGYRILLLLLAGMHSPH